MSKSYTTNELKLLVEKIISQMNFEIFGSWIENSKLTEEDKNNVGTSCNYGLYNNLLGSALTVLDACLPDENQRKAAHSLLRAKFSQTSSRTEESVERIIKYLADKEKMYFDEESNLAQAREMIYKN